MKKELTAKQERFCQLYLETGFNATEAAKQAGYSAKTAYSIGQRNLQRPEIADRIQKMQDNLAETSGISALRVAKELEKIAFSSVANLNNTWIDRKAFEELSEIQKACIQEISTKVVKKNIGTKGEPEWVDVEYIKVRTHDKLKALDALVNLLGYNAPVKQEITGKDGKDLIPESQIDYSKLSTPELKDLHALLEKASTREEPDWYSGK